MSNFGDWRLVPHCSNALRVWSSRGTDSSKSPFTSFPKHAPSWKGEASRARVCDFTSSVGFSPVTSRNVKDSSPSRLSQVYDYRGNAVGKGARLILESETKHVLCYVSQMADRLWPCHKLVHSATCAYLRGNIFFISNHSQVSQHVLQSSQPPRVHPCTYTQAISLIGLNARYKPRSYPLLLPLHMLAGFVTRVHTHTHVYILNSPVIQPLSARIGRRARVSPPRVCIHNLPHRMFQVRISPEC